jgi:surface-adhesin protein E
MDYDCAEQRYEGLEVMYVSGNMGSGNLLDRSTGKGRWQRISPGSLDQSLWKLACGKK